MEDSFKFKHFEVLNRASSMKVGTDGVLLGAWMDIKADDSLLLDIGAGTGIISLIAAQRLSLTQFSNSNYSITALEIDSPSAKEAVENFNKSPWSKNLFLKNISIQNFVESNKFDLIFSNPPFFNNSLKAPDSRRSTARHTDTLPYEHLVKAAQTLLKPNGRLALILPAEEGDYFIKKMDGIYLKRLCKVKTTANKPPKRYLMEFTVEDNSLDISENYLVMQENGEYTQRYKDLTKDLYLRF